LTHSGDELRVENLRGGYAGTLVLDGVSFCVGAGGKLGILGRNGVGKTTMFACIMGLAQIHSGCVTFGRTDITALPTWRRARRTVGTARLGRTGCAPKHEVATMFNARSTIMSISGPTLDFGTN
jgi:ABC-type branched-subunit amino acid transport system ATPase component